MPLPEDWTHDDNIRSAYDATEDRKTAIAIMKARGKEHAIARHFRGEIS
jgi:hypothetical protein